MEKEKGKKFELALKKEGIPLADILEILSKKNRDKTAKEILKEKSEKDNNKKDEKEE